MMSINTVTATAAEARPAPATSLEALVEGLAHPMPSDEPVRAGAQLPVSGALTTAEMANRVCESRPVGQPVGRLVPGHLLASVVVEDVHTGWPETVATCECGGRFRGVWWDGIVIGPRQYQAMHAAKHAAGLL